MKKKYFCLVLNFVGCVYAMEGPVSSITIIDDYIQTPNRAVGMVSQNKVDPSTDIPMVDLQACLGAKEAPPASAAKHRKKAHREQTALRSSDVQLQVVKQVTEAPRDEEMRKITEVSEQLGALSEVTLIHHQEQLQELKQLRDENAQLKRELLKKHNGAVYNTLSYVGFGVRGIASAGFGYYAYSYAAGAALVLSPFVYISPLAPIAFGLTVAGVSYFGISRGIL